MKKENIMNNCCKPFDGLNNVNFHHEFIHFAAGSIAGITSAIFIMPFDTIKVRMQTNPDMYRNLIQCFHHTVHNEGIIRGLYAGIAPAVMAAFLEYSVLFAVYNKSLELVTFNAEPIKHLFAGATAGMFVSLTLCPMEVVKCNLQVSKINKNVKKFDCQNLKKPTTFQMAKCIYINEGFRGFFSGISPMVTRNIIGFSIFFSVYEYMKNMSRTSEENKSEIGRTKTMISGAAAGLISWALSFPADVIKSRVQVENIKQSMVSTAIKIAKEEGFKAFFKGISPTLLRTMPNSAILLIVYEISAKTLTKFIM